MVGGVWVVVAIAFWTGEWNGARADSRTLCLHAGEILKELPLKGDAPEIEDGRRPQVQVSYEPTKVRHTEHKNTIRIDGYFVRRWTDDTLAFAHQQPCDTLISLSERLSSVWSPPLSFSNGRHIVYHKHSKAADLTDDGTLTLKQRVEQEVECTVIGDAEPFFGSFSCPIRIKAEQAPAVDYIWMWKDPSLNHTYVYQHMPFDDATQELSMNILLSSEIERPLLKFFLPSIMFMGISWLSLALGPMVITRSLLIVSSFILLMMHYSNQSLPDTDTITSIDLWKTFSFAFVLIALGELVMVTCMASLGRSRSFLRCCCRTHKKGSYDIEPQYEELNDLRQRKTRRTCNCCRYSALFFDFITMFALLALFTLFCFVFFTKREFLTGQANEFRVRNIIPRVF